MNNKVGVLIGTRPGIIKMSPLVHELARRDAEHIVIHTGQHYSLQMDRQIMKDVGLDEPDYHITRPAECISHAQQTAYMLIGVEKILLKEKPKVLLVCGDANTNMAGALAARKIHVEVGHVEAGLRSFDWRMPEEHNRVIIDHISEYLFAPTHRAKKYLQRDGVRGTVFVVGNTIVEATLRYSKIAKERGLSKVTGATEGKPFILLTFHREENVDSKEILNNLVQAMLNISEDYGYLIVFPVHPRTSKRLAEFAVDRRVSRMPNLRLIEPQGYLDFLAFLSQATIVLTDSGGVQEECCILQVPCVTLRESTERQETIAVGANLLAGTQKQSIIQVFDRVVKALPEIRSWPNPYGDGKASKRIIDTCLTGHPEDELSGYEYEEETYDPNLVCNG